MRPIERLSTQGYDVETSDAVRFNRYRFVLSREGDQVGTGTHFTGGKHIRPWIELQPANAFSPDKGQDQQLFDALTDLLDPGSHLMVHYLQDTTTAEAITHDVPPMATPLGFLMWDAGCRWYKDWYFTEGWMEGDQKLQGNLPVDEETRKEREHEAREMLDAFLASDDQHWECRDLAETVLQDLQ